MLTLGPITSESLGERLADELRHRILAGELPGGTRIVEEDLAVSSGVSRGPVRDAIRILRAEGLVAGKGRNVVVRQPTSADIDELMTLREAFELLAVERAMTVGPDSLVASLNSALDDMDAAAAALNPGRFTAADLRFHGAFFASAAMPRLSVVWEQFRPTIEGLLYLSGKRDTDLAHSAREHHDLTALIVAGDLPAVQASIREHLAKTRVRLKSAVPQQPL